MKTNLLKLIMYSFLLVSYLFINSALFAQQDMQSSESIYDKILRNQPSSYKEAVKVFLYVYGDNPDSWPSFIVKAEKIYIDYLELYPGINAMRGPDDFFKAKYNIDINEMPFNYQTSFIPILETFRNYLRMHWYSIQDPGQQHEKYEEQMAKEDPILLEYLTSTFREDLTNDIGIRVLPVVLFMYAHHCPPQMLEWFFREVFPVFDAIHGVDKIQDLIKTLESIDKHINRLVQNGEFTRARIWSNTFHHLSYSRYYQNIDIAKIISGGIRDNQKIEQSIKDEAEERKQRVQEIFYRNIENFGPLPLFVQNRSVPMFFVEINRKYSTLNSVGFHFNKNPIFKEKYPEIEPIASFPDNVDMIFYSYGRTLQYTNVERIAEEFSNFTLISAEGYLKFLHSFIPYDSDLGRGNEEIVLFESFAINEATLKFKIRDNFNYFYIRYSEMGDLPLTLRENDRKQLVSYFQNLFINSVLEVWSGNEIAPDIHGYKLPERKRNYAIRADAEPKSVKPDGESTLEIIATLYDYVPGDMQSARPIAGKTLNFHVRSQYGIVPGTLSDVSAVTDANGQARVTYTAPKAELLSESRSLINTSTVAARSEEFDVDDLAYIHFIPDRGEVRVEPPIKGIISDHGIVPPDGRFPALIRALIEDSDLQPLPSTPVNVALKGDHTYGMLRAPDGTESKELTLITDGRGWVELQYFFASDRIPEAAVIETIEIKTAHMSIPLRAKVSIGLNLVFDRVESAYEGRGIINAGERIPLRMKIKDAWYPEIDLSRILNYWGWGSGAGDTRLYPRLEIENLSSIPDYLLDHLRQERYPEPGFDEMMKVVTFRSETGEIREQNLLYVFESSLRPYGYPQVRPVASGNHYYQARISLVDQQGETIPHARHPATKTYFNLQTDMPADALYIYFVNNPLRPQTPEAEWYAFALDFMGMGTLISVVDAMDAINRGDTEALFDIMFSELKGFFMDKAKDNSPDFKKVMDGYSRLTMAKTVLDEIDKSVSGVVAQLEHQLFTRLAKNIDNEKEELIILKGTGNQKLFLTAPEEEDSGSNRKKGRSLFGGLINVQITGVDEKTQDKISKLIGRKKEAEIPAYENRLHVDKGLGIYSLKSGNVSYFIIPAGLEVDYENATEMLRY